MLVYESYKLSKFIPINDEAEFVCESKREIKQSAFLLAVSKRSHLLGGVIGKLE